MYVCEECGAAYTSTEAEYGGSIFDMLTPTTCGCGGRLVETHKCISCNEWFPSEDYGICPSCVESGKTLENVLKIGAECTESIAINGFIASYFANHISELEDILKAEILKKSQTEEQVVIDAIDTYCEFDRDYFVEWLEEKCKQEK